MRFVQAFEALGYSLPSAQQTWSAEKPDGVCITIWQSEMQMEKGTPWLDTRLHCGPLEVWLRKAANTKRKRHLQRAIREFGGRVDVVIVRGPAGESVDSADPWIVSNRRGFHWQVSEFAADTGHFTARAVGP